jgi:hypothetical protein
MFLVDSAGVSVDLRGCIFPAGEHRLTAWQAKGEKRHTPMCVDARNTPLHNDIEIFSFRSASTLKSLPGVKERLRVDFEAVERALQ